MTLVTLSGTISASDLNTNFRDKRAALYATTEPATSRKTFLYEIFNKREGGTGLTSSTAVGFRTEDFTVPDDLQLLTMGLSFVNPDATSRTITLTLTAIDSLEVSVPKYLTSQTISISKTGASAAEHTAIRLTPSIPVGLVKGLTYRLQLSSSSATAITSAYGFLLAGCKRRYR
jgi:hypothetical protein